MKRGKAVLVTAVAGAICASTGYAFAATASAAGTPITGAGNRCLTAVRGHLWRAGTVRATACAGGAAQQWTAGAHDSLQARGRCLDVRSSGTADGTAVQLWQCNGTPAQQWRQTARGTLVNPHADKCLDASAANLRIRTCTGAAAQQWRRGTPPTGGTGPTTRPTPAPSSARPKPPTTPPTTPPTKAPTTAPAPGSTVTITSDCSQATDLCGWLDTEVGILKTWYPKIAAMLPTAGYTPPTTFSVSIDPGYTGVAYTTGTRIVASANYLRQHRSDTGFLVHEAVHVDQQNKNAPGWFIEGSADYVRYFFYEPGKIQAPGPSAHYTDGYGTSAWFLNYLATQYDAQIVAEVMDAGRRGAYTDALWQQHTGKTLDALWAEMPKR